MDTSLVLFLNSLYRENIFIKGLVIFGSEILPYVIVGLLVAWIFLSRDRKKSIRHVTTILLSALIAVTCANFLKYWVGASRPFVVLESVQGFMEHDPYGSFPSAHMTFFTALAMAAFRRHIALSGALFAGALIIGVSRVASGVHFPIDIIAGFFLGLGVGYLVDYAERKYQEAFGWKRKILFWKR